MKTKVQFALLDLVVAQMRRTILTNIVITLLVGAVIVPTFGMTVVVI